MMKTEKLIYSRDDIPAYVPRNPRFVLLGTMAAINARQIEDHSPPIQPYFFYNNKKNRFWKYMWQIFEAKEIPNDLSVQDKKDFCERWGMAMCNLVDEMKIHKDDAKNRTDTIIFKSNALGLIKTKVVPFEFLNVLKSKPIFFTCYDKDGLRKLLELFFKTNNLDTKIVKHITYLHTPAMPGRGDVLSSWKHEFRKLISRS